MCDRNKVNAFISMLRAQVDYFNTTVDDRVQIKIDVLPKHTPEPYVENIKAKISNFDKSGNFIS